MKKVLFLIVKIIVSVALVYWLIQKVDWRQMWVQIYNVSWPFLLAYIVSQLIGNFISARKWQIIASFKELHFTAREGFFVYLSGAFINNFMPSTLGGDAYRGLWLAKRSGAKAASLSTVVFDRFSGLWMLAFLALALSPLLFPFVKSSVPLYLTLIILATFFVIDIVITYAYCQPWFHHLISRIPFQKVKRLFEEVTFYTKKHIWWQVGTWSALFIFVGIVLSNYMLFRAVGSDLKFIPFLSVIFLVTLISSVPLSINNIGIKEWAYVTFFGLLGVSVETAVTVSILSRFLQMLISFIALPYYLKKKDTGEENIS